MATKSKGKIRQSRKTPPETGHVNAPGNNEELKCFVMMPFGSNNEYARGNLESDFVFDNIIVPALDKFKKNVDRDVNVVREVDRNVSGSITKSILQNMATADISIVDITGRNPNVFFELGIRYCLRHRVTILLRQDNTDVPFDIRGYKCITYDCFKPKQAIACIVESLMSGFSEPSVVDSMVFETFPKMQVKIPGILESMRDSSDSSNLLSWNEWWARVLELSRLLKESFDNGRFVPNAILGISNGGLLVADLLGREVFKGIPILSLWANRWLSDKSKVDQSCYYFDNKFNRSTMKTLRTMGTKPKDKITILLTDDLIFTSSTIVQAAAFIKRELKDNYDLLFTPLYCRDPDYLDTIKDILPYGYNHGKTFDAKENDYYKRLCISRASFPYKKSLGMA